MRRLNWLRLRFIFEDRRDDIFAEHDAAEDSLEGIHLKDQIGVASQIWDRTIPRFLIEYQLEAIRNSRYK